MYVKLPDLNGRLNSAVLGSPLFYLHTETQSHKVSDLGVLVCLPSVGECKEIILCRRKCGVYMKKFGKFPSD